MNNKGHEKTQCLVIVEKNSAYDLLNNWQYTLEYIAWQVKCKAQQNIYHSVAPTGTK
jgi:hypothetical protein